MSMVAAESRGMFVLDEMEIQRADCDVRAPPLGNNSALRLAGFVELNSLQSSNFLFLLRTGGGWREFGARLQHAVSEGVCRQGQ